MACRADARVFRLTSGFAFAFDQPPGSVCVALRSKRNQLDFLGRLRPG